MIASLLLMLCLSPMWGKVSTAPVDKICKIKNTDVIFVLDTSTSITNLDFQETLKFVLKFVDDTPVIGKEGTAVGIYTFGTGFRNEIPLGKYQDKASLKSAILTIKSKGGSTETHLVLDDVRENGFSARSDARPDAQRAVVVITDGESVDTEKTKIAAVKLHQANIFTFAIGVGSEISKEEMKTIASTEENFSYVKNFQALKTVEEKVNRVICDQKEVPPVDKICKIKKTDIIFVLDSSGSIKDPDFKEIQRFVLQFVDATPMIGKKGVQVGIYTFSTDFRYEIEVGKYQNKEALKSAIMSIRRSRGGTHTHLVLDDVLKNGFSARANARLDAQRAVVVITDGESEEPERTKMAAAALHKANIITFAVGVGRNTGKFELRAIGSSDDNISCVKNFQALEKVGKQMNSVICDQKQSLGRHIDKAEWKKVLLSKENFHSVIKYSELESLENSINKVVCKKPLCSINPVDVVFVLDSSSSLKDEDFKKEIDFVTAFVTRSEIGPKHIQISLFTFADKSNFLIKLNDFKDKKALLQKLKGIKRDQGNTFTNIALDDVRMHAFSYTNGGRGSGAKQAVIVLTDGSSVIPEATKKAADTLHSLNVDVFAVGIGKKVDFVELYNIGNNRNNVVTVPDFEGLKNIEKQILQKVCVTHKKVPEIVCSINPVDVVFVLDSSSSLKDEDFKKEIDFVTAFVTRSEIGPKHIQISLFTFADKSNFLIKLNDFKDKKALLQKLKGIRRDQGNTFTNIALDDVRMHAFSYTNGGRGSGAKQAVIVLTDGSSVIPEATKKAADTLHSLNVDVFAVGIGKKVDFVELYNIGNNRNNVVTVPDFEGLKSIEKQILQKVCVTHKKETERVCESVPVDVIFVLDSSDSVKQNDVQNYIKFLTNFVKHAKIGPQNIQVGLFLFADDSSLVIKLSDLNNKEQLLQRIQGLKRIHGGTYTDKALEDVRTHGFAATNGGRGKKAKQVAIVITDGESLLPKKTKAAAQALRAMNVQVFAIGVGKENIGELRDISSDSNHLYEVSDSGSLSSIEHQLFKKICHNKSIDEGLSTPSSGGRNTGVGSTGVSITTPPIIVCKSVPVDVIFVLDSSDSVKQNDVQIYIKFLTNFVKHAKIGPQNIQVGLFLFADDSSLVIKLSDLNDKEQLLQRIQGLKRIHGGTYTDKALEDVRTHGFAAANGGRGKKAKQVAIVITDGESLLPKKTKAAAQALRAMNVQVYAIGIGKKNIGELRDISSDSNHLYTVPDFKSLSSIEHELFKEICHKKSGNGDRTTPSNGGETNTTPKPNQCNEDSKKMADVVFLLDNSDSVTDDMFTKEKMMVKKFISSHTMGPQDVQVSVITFGDKATEAFNLKQNVGDIQRSKGSTKTEEALKLAKSKSLQQSNGARTASHKVVIVITDGSSDDVYKTHMAAKALQENGVNIFCIGIGNPDIFELEKLTGNPSKIFMTAGGIDTISKKIFDGECGPVKA